MRKFLAALMFVLAFIWRCPQAPSQVSPPTSYSVSAVPTPTPTQIYVSSKTPGSYGPYTFWVAVNYPQGQSALSNPVTVDDFGYPLVITFARQAGATGYSCIFSSKGGSLPENLMSTASVQGNTCVLTTLGASGAYVTPLPLPTTYTFANGAGLSPAAVITGAIRDAGGQVFNVKAYGALGNGATDDTAAIQAAIAAAGCGTIIFPAGTYVVSGTITKPQCGYLSGVGVPSDGAAAGSYSEIRCTGYGVCLLVTTTQSNEYALGGISRLELLGPGSGVSTSTGLFLGGDPAGVISPATNFGAFQTISDVVVTGFGNGVEIGNYTFRDAFINDHLDGNGNGLYIPSGLNYGEPLEFHGGAIFNNSSYGFSDNSNQQVDFYGTSFDYNGVAIGGESVEAALFGAYFEQAEPPFVNSTGADVVFASFGSHYTTTGGTEAAAFFSFATTAASVYMAVNSSSDQFTASAKVDELVNWNVPNATGNQVLALANDVTISNGTAGVTVNFNGSTAVDYTVISPNQISQNGVTWSITGAPPTGACTSGSISSNKNGASGSTLYACVSSAWVDVK